MSDSQSKWNISFPESVLSLVSVFLLMTQLTLGDVKGDFFLKFWFWTTDLTLSKDIQNVTWLPYLNDTTTCWRASFAKPLFLYNNSSDTNSINKTSLLGLTKSVECNSLWQYTLVILVFGAGNLFFEIRGCASAFSSPSLIILYNTEYWGTHRRCLIFFLKQKINGFSLLHKLQVFSY